MGRRPCCRKEGLNRGAWSAREDKLLINYIKIHGEGKWRDLPEKAGLKRCGKSCRLRWLNYLRPDIKRGNISVDEEDLIIRLHKLLGNRWSLIAGRLPGRTDNEIKNYWNTNLSKRVGNHGMHNPHSSKNMKGRTKNYPKKFKQARPAAVEPHRVIRTKAVRCSKVVIPGLLENEKLDIVGENISPSAVQQGQDDLADLLMDFDISELLLPEGLSSASPMAKEIGENKLVGGDCNVLEDMSPHPDYCSHFAHGKNFDDLTCGGILPENHGTIEPLPEFLDLKSLYFLNSEDHEWNIDRRQI